MLDVDNMRFVDHLFVINYIDVWVQLSVFLRMKSEYAMFEMSLTSQ